MQPDQGLDRQCELVGCDLLAVVADAEAEIVGPALRAELLGGPTAGYFAVKSKDGRGPSLQRYAGNTMVLETIWPNLTVTDYLDVSDGRPTLLAGRSDLIRHLSGSGEAVRLCGYLSGS